jgi:succinate dehydrogenase/fumarate reductase cytochrome b subunit
MSLTSGVPQVGGTGIKKIVFKKWAVHVLRHVLKGVRDLTSEWERYGGY